MAGQRRLAPGADRDQARAILARLCRRIGVSSGRAVQGGLRARTSLLGLLAKLEQLLD